MHWNPTRRNEIFQNQNINNQLLGRSKRTVSASCSRRSQPSKEHVMFTNASINAIGGDQAKYSSNTYGSTRTLWKRKQKYAGMHWVVKSNGYDKTGVIPVNGFGNRNVTGEFTFKESSYGKNMKSRTKKSVTRNS